MNERHPSAFAALAGLRKEVARLTLENASLRAEIFRMVEDGAKTILPDAVYAELEAECADDLDWIEAEFGVRLTTSPPLRQS